MLLVDFFKKIIVTNKGCQKYNFTFVSQAQEIIRVHFRTRQQERKEEPGSYFFYFQFRPSVMGGKYRHGRDFRK